MFVEGVFDGTAVRQLKSLDLLPNQRVFIDIPTRKISQEEQQKINEKIEAVNGIFGMLSPTEEKIFDEVIADRLNFHERVTL